MKKKLALLLLAIIMATLPLTAFAQTANEPEFVPLRQAFEQRGASVEWNDELRAIHIAIYGVNIVLAPGSTVAYVNDAAVELQHPLTLLQGVAYVYVNDVSALWDALITAFIGESPFVLHLTEDARDIALYDFDYLVTAILENSPWESVINRRFDTDFRGHMAYLRQAIQNMRPVRFAESLEEFYARTGSEMGDVWFPIRDNDDPRYIAATYLSYFLLFEMWAFEGIGHLFPRDLRMYRIQYRDLRILDHQGHINPETDPITAMRLGNLTHPDVRWFYGSVDVDLDADRISVFPEVPDNIITDIIAPGHIAYMRVNSFATSAEYDDLVIAPFFEEIQDFEHLILDLRGNGGGFMFNFTHNIFRRLIHWSMPIVTYQFFTDGDLAVATMIAERDSIAYWHSHIEGNDVFDWYTIDILPAFPFIIQQNMVNFNREDLFNLEHVLVEVDWIFPREDGPLFEGWVWLLIDGGTASASSQATLMLMETYFTTVIGENTSGVMAAVHTYVILPNTGMLFRIDLGYRTDMYGNSLEVYGIAPHIHNLYQMDALETALAVIEFYDHGWPLDGADELWRDIADDDIDFTYHPLLGDWVWDADSSYIYEFRADGTGTRGFDFFRYEFQWHAEDSTLLMYIDGFVEHWTFTIEDDVLTIVSEQFQGLRWHYIRQ